ncbi:hypothetical protein CLU79DRAFT_773313 [Phycomyces nitens]|nr:hypothetical protein CLU79DRAFT_773313 [Phycomyces nitens]
MRLWIVHFFVSFYYNFCFNRLGNIDFILHSIYHYHKNMPFHITNNGISFTIKVIIVHGKSNFQPE